MFSNQNFTMRSYHELFVRPELLCLLKKEAEANNTTVSALLDERLWEYYKNAGRIGNTTSDTDPETEPGACPKLDTTLEEGDR